MADAAAVGTPPRLMFPTARADGMEGLGGELRRPDPVSTPPPDATQGLRNHLGVLPAGGGDDSDGDHLLDAYSEGLGEDFRNTPWKRPSEELALEHRLATMYVNGRAGILGTADTSLFQLGEGVGLYFIYLRRMLLFTIFATVLALPHLLICYHGGSLTQAAMDPLRLLKFSAGNHRITNVSDSTAIGYHPCTSEGDFPVDTLFDDGATCNDQFMKLLHKPEVILTATHGSYLMAACDVLCCFLFMVMYWTFAKEIALFEERADRENATPADYAVEVRGLPEDAQDEEVIRHFSELFRLDKPGWTYEGWCCGKFGRKRADTPEDVIDCAGASIGAALKPVEDTKHSRFDHICKGSWLAECVLAHPEGAFIRQARDMTAVSERILAARAHVKKIRGARRSRMRRSRLRMAERHLGKLQAGLERGARELTSRAQKFEFISWKTSSAFVVFNHETSVTRCLADYARYPRWLQPKQLRFRGMHKLRVTRAPEAGNILWENLELTNKQRARRKTLTLWVTIVLLGLSFAVLSGSKIGEKVFNSADSETEERCLVTIPEQHRQPAQTPYVGYNSDDRCGAGDLWVSVEGSPFQFPGQENRCVEPCVDPSNTNRIDCGNGTRLTQSQIATCLCRQEIEDEGFGALEFVKNAGGGCWTYGTEYYFGQLLTIVASANVVIINFGLKHALKRMGAFERHPSVTEQAVSTSWKIALALFINSACVVLLVNLPGSFTVVGSSDTQSAARTATEAADSAEWYMTTGEALLTTIAINVVAPRTPDILEYRFFGPWRRRKSSSAAAITQRELNKKWKGRNFDLSSRLPITLMMMAVAVTFSPALPVLFPMVALYLVCTYFGDKFYLLRVCRTPPQYDGRIVKMAVESMPWMLVCHCLFALFAFSGTGIFSSEFVADLMESNTVEEAVGADRVESTKAVSSSIRVICLPFVIIPALIFAYTIFSNTIGRMLRLLWSIISCRCFMGSVKVNALRLQVTNPPYIEVFERGYPPRETIPEFFEKEFEWLVREDAKGCHFLTKARTKKSLGGTPGGSPVSARRNGTMGLDLMLTWEVLQSIYPTHTFHMEDNPAYRDIVVTRNVIAKELGISTPKSPGGKLWSPTDYRAYTGKGKGIRKAERKGFNR